MVEEEALTKVREEAHKKALEKMAAAQKKKVPTFMNPTTKKPWILIQYRMGESENAEDNKEQEEEDELEGEDDDW